MAGYFSDETSLSTRAFYALLCLITLVYSLIGLFSPLLTPKCDIPLLDKDPFRRRLVQVRRGLRRPLPRAGTHAARVSPRPPPTLALAPALIRIRILIPTLTLAQGLEGGLEDAPNPSYRPDPCRWRRYGVLLGLNKWEAEMCCRVIISILMGSTIGFERRRADRPAGIRTMAMVCLGACVFTIDSMFAFVDGTMGWDASRVSAAIPSGVGFLGAASIWKGTRPKIGESGEQVPEVHGLTTATSVWLSAAVGLLCGGGLYMPALFATASSVVYLRFAPRLNGSYHGDEEEDEALGLEAQCGAGLTNLLSPTRAQLTEQLLRNSQPGGNPSGVERRDSTHSFASNRSTAKKGPGPGSGSPQQPTRGHPPPQRPTRLLRATPLGPRGAPSPRGCRSEPHIADVVVFWPTQE